MNYQNTIAETASLLQANGFSKEATAMVCGNLNRYLPLLATLANYSAKNICPSYYDSKADLLSCIEDAAVDMGWRTFQSYDGDTSNYPYIFYFETGYTPQVSFHSDREYRTNSTGKWSGVSVQEIAPKLIKNLLKKDGFKGQVWDFSKIAVNLIQAASVGEVSHLHKGNDYIFSAATGELVVGCQGQAIITSEGLLQSFMTRVAKQFKKLAIEDSESQSDFANQNKSEHYNDTNPSQEI